MQAKSAFFVFLRTNRFAFAVGQYTPDRYPVNTRPTPDPKEQNNNKFA